MRELQIVETVSAMRAWSRAARAAGRKVGCVPTMGYLHEGHLALLRECQRRADVVVMTLFVNPTQFGPHEDLDRYPRDFEGDCEKAAAAGAAVVFCPKAEEMYPPGYQTYVTVDELSRDLEGAFRPTHFRGVATVVTKLFHAVEPAVAVFGEKDYQQLKVIERMTRDLDWGIEIVGHPTVREPDGLAMSSRNVYLSSQERAQALSISQSLFAAQRAVEAGERDPLVLAAGARNHNMAAGGIIDYLEVRDADTLQTVLTLSRPARMLVAARVGKTRLIDNIALAITEDMDIIEPCREVRR
jgi:pantoate--beta-alanine ligase